MLLRALLVAISCASAYGLTPFSAAADDNDCALYLSGPGRTSAYDYSLNLLRGNFGYEGQHTCITYDAVNQAYLDARKRILVSQPKGDWGPEDFASVGELILDISINLARTYGLTYEEIEKGLPLIDTSRTLIREVCPPIFSHVECRAGKYRRLDGLCNNLKHPTWGASMAPFQRLLGPLFADGINAPRIAHSGRDLPLSRVVSRTMHPDDGFHDHAGTVMVIAWGQFMDHDYTLTGTPLDPRNRNDPEECCKRPKHLKHPYCNEIRVPDDDYFYKLFGVKCIDFVRGFPSPRPGCRLGSRVPFNTLTGAIDGNTVYGVTEKFARKLRTGYGGLLRMNPIFKEYGLKDLLPLKLDIPDEGCTRPNKNMYCFEAGEIRVNEQLVLTVMHTLMAREHNRVAKGLAEVNPHWDDETLFQEARRINVAEIQHITYNEFLPILLGKDVMDKFGLVLNKEGYWDGYDQNVNPDVIDAFASAAYRFGHSLLPTAVERWSKAHKFIASKRLSDLIRRPYDLYRAGVLDEYVMGLMNQVAQAMDDSITQEVTNHLFKKVGARFGMDLVSFNMQRGREFGIPGYMEFRKFCGLNGAETFQELFGSMPNATIQKYESIFEHPIDVDLWSGGVSERPLPGSMLGPTFACIIATQFSYSRRGDRFWYELPNQPSSFTPEQLVEVRKARLARVICDNTDIIDTVQLYPMVLPDHELNPRVPCRSGIIPSIDFSKWAEPAPFAASGKQLITDAVATGMNETCVERSVNGINDTLETPTVANQTNRSIQVSKSITKNPQHPILSILNKSNDFGTNAVNHKFGKSVQKNKIQSQLLKSSGHAKNSIQRKKRSYDVKTKSVPLNFDYKLNHRNLNGINNKMFVKDDALADFNIVTFHSPRPIEKEQILKTRDEKHPHNNYRHEYESKRHDQEGARLNEPETKNVNTPKINGNFDAYLNHEYQISSPTQSSENQELIENEKEDNIHLKSTASEENIELKEKYSDVNEDPKLQLKEKHTAHEEYIDRNVSNNDSKSQENNNSGEHGGDPLHKSKNHYEEDGSTSKEFNNSSNEDPSENDEVSAYNSKHRLEPQAKYETSGEEINYTRESQSDEHIHRHNSASNENNSKEHSTKKRYKASGEENNDSEEYQPKVINKTSNEDNDDKNGHIRNEQHKASSDESNSMEKYIYDHKTLNDKHNNKIKYLPGLKHAIESVENDDVKEYQSKNRYKTSSEEKHDNEEYFPSVGDKSLIKKDKIKKEHLPNSKEELKENEERGFLKKELSNINRYDSDDSIQSTPIPTQDDNTNQFSYERGKPNNNGGFKPYRDTSSQENDKIGYLRPGLYNGKEGLLNNHLFKLNQGEIKPVMEINREKENLENDSSESILPFQTDFKDDKLEEFLEATKVKNSHNLKTNDIEKATNPESNVKQEFERIPLNYNHDNSNASIHQNINTSSDNADITDNPLIYDDKFKFKFDAINITLPEIKLPEDITAYNYDVTEEDVSKAHGENEDDYPNNESENHSSKSLLTNNDENSEDAHNTDDYIDKTRKDNKLYQVSPYKKNQAYYDTNDDDHYNDYQSHKQDKKRFKAKKDYNQEYNHSNDGEESSEVDSEKRHFREKGKKGINAKENYNQKYYHSHDDEHSAEIDSKKQHHHQHDKKRIKAKENYKKEYNHSHDDEDSTEVDSENQRNDKYEQHHKDDESKEDYNDNDDDDDDEDLYEKFVRERFGKQGTFQKRSEKFTSLDPKLYDRIGNILKKTKETGKEADKSGDPNAAYAWTLEYGQKLV